MRWRPRHQGFEDDVRRQLDDGPGFVVLTGLPVGASLDGAEVLALEIAAQFGEVLPQDRTGLLTCLVRDEGHVLRPGRKAGLLSRSARSSKSREALEFHNDSAPRWMDQRVDLVAMLVVHQAATGGETILASARTAYEILCAEDPKAVITLCEDFTFDRTLPGVDHPDASSGPVFAPYGRRLAMRCNRVRIETAAADSGAPLGPQQVDALDALDAVLVRPELHHRVTLRPGECLLVDDHTVVHGRTAYRDAAGPPRCLVRVWVRRADLGVEDRLYQG